MSKDYSSNYDVRSWIAGALSDERLYGDGEPTWSKAETPEEACSRRLSTVRVLEKAGDQGCIAHSIYNRIAERLASCEPRRRCFSGACPEWGRALQRYFVKETQALLQSEFPGPDEVVAVSIVWKEGADGFLASRSPRSLQNAVKRVLRAGGVHFALGGVDLSVNEDRDGGFSGHWSHHLWLLLPSENRVIWEQFLRQSCPPRYAVPRPIKIQPFDGDAAGLAYALKTDFVRRVSYQQVKENGDEIRICRNTSDQPLRVGERLELLPYLDDAGLAQRMFLLGARPTKTRAGYSIVRIDG